MVRKTCGSEMTKQPLNYKKIALRVFVTFFEGVVPFLALNHWNVTNKAILEGAGGVGISAVWNTVIYPYIAPYLSK